MTRSEAEERARAVLNKVADAGVDGFHYDFEWDVFIRFIADELQALHADTVTEWDPRPGAGY